MPKPDVDTFAGATAAPVQATKVERGQFFTLASPFDHPVFHRWLGSIDAGTTFVEPFAGSNNLVRMATPLIEAAWGEATWRCFDIEPQDPDVQTLDSLRSLPRDIAAGRQAIITNPPYMARNVAARLGLTEVVDRCGDWDNLYKRCLEVCLENAGWVCAIIPESFVTSGAFRQRLENVVSLDQALFTDTEVPVCLAFWGPESADDFAVWRGRRPLGLWSELVKHVPGPAAEGSRLHFNDVGGQIGLLAVDRPVGASIRFIDGSEIPDEAVKVSARSRTRILVDDLHPDDTPALLTAANSRLARLRVATADVVLTPFMGPRKDGQYRRRLDFATARNLLAHALVEVEALRGSQSSTMPR